MHAAVNSLDQVSPSVLDRALIFPLFLIGCMTNNLGFRAKIQQRIGSQDEAFGNLRNARLLMEHVWRLRVMTSGPSSFHGVEHVGNRYASVDWRQAMRDMGLDLLFL